MTGSMDLAFSADERKPLPAVARVRMIDCAPAIFDLITAKGPIDHHQGAYRMLACSPFGGHCATARHVQLVGGPSARINTPASRWEQHPRCHWTAKVRATVLQPLPP
jgi:hypothetical protein